MLARLYCRKSPSARIRVVQTLVAWAVATVMALFNLLSVQATPKYSLITVSSKFIFEYALLRQTVHMNILVFSLPMLWQLFFVKK